MKLRQKLAMVLAAAMVVTAVPVTTMAASTNAFNKTVSMTADKAITTGDSLTLDVKIAKQNKVASTVFFLKSEAFEFDINGYIAAANDGTSAENALNALNAEKDELKVLEDALKVLEDALATEKAKTSPVAAEIARLELAIVDKNSDIKIQKAEVERHEDLLQAQIDLHPVLQFNGFTMQVTSKTSAIVTVNALMTGTPLTGVEKEVNIPVIGTPKKGTPSITIDGEDSLATSGKYVIGGGEVVTDKLLSATVDGDPANISIDGKGELGNIKIDEAVKGSLAGKTILIELDRSTDLEFAKSQTITVQGERGLAGKTFTVSDSATATGLEYGFYKEGTDDEDKTILELKFGTQFTTTQRGAVILKGIDVVPEDAREGADLGAVEVTITEKDEKMAETDLVVANVTDFGLELKAKEDIKLVAGKEAKKVKIQFNELAAGSINDNRDVFFKIDGATVTKFDKKEFKDGNDLIATLTYDADDKEFQLHFEANFDEEKINKFEFEVEMYAKAAYEGDIKVIASSRDFKDIEGVIGTVTPAVAVEANDMTVKVGLNGQVGGEIKVTEVEAETFERGEWITIELNDKGSRDGIKIEAAKVEVTEGDLELQDIKVEGNVIKAKVKRESDEASTITVSEIEVDVNRTTPEGAYDVIVGGDAISDRNEKKFEDASTVKDGDYYSFDNDVFKVEEFIIVGTKNTQDLPTAAVKKEVVLAIGSAEYTVNGEAKTGVAAPYVEAGRTMIPLRLVSEEFGANVDFGTLNGVGTVTIQKEGQVIQFQNGSNIMNQNGIAVPMDAKTVITNGTTYVPFRYLANALGTAFTWDAETQTIVFKN